MASATRKNTTSARSDSPGAPVSGKPVTQSGSRARTMPESRAAVTDSPATGSPDAIRDSGEPVSQSGTPSGSRRPAARDQSLILIGRPSPGAIRIACRLA